MSARVRWRESRPVRPAEHSRDPGRGHGPRRAGCSVVAVSGLVGARRAAVLVLSAALGLVAALSGCSSDAGDGGDDVVLDARALSQVQVVDGRLVDGWGREVRVHGINARIEGIFDVVFDDGRERLQPLPDWESGECQELARAGFNLLRLPINWSGIEPEEGAFDEAYLQRVDAVVDDCAGAGVYVLIDLHQDAWSKHIGEDGAPLWAIIPAPTTLLGGPLDEGELSRRRVSAQVRAAFESFWENRENLQERWVPMWRLVVRRWSDRPEVIGFQPMNEPVFSEHDRLYAFYARAHAAMRQENTVDPLWVEPDAIRNFALSAPVPPAPFLGSNVVYAPHFYPGLAGRRGSDVESWTRQIRASLEAMREEATAWGDAALVVGEWGADPRDPGTAAYAEAFLSVMDTLGGGHALWLWKENSQGFWGLFDHHPGRSGADAWTLRPEAARIFAPPHAIAVPGRLVSHRFESESVRLEVVFDASGVEGAAPVLHLPASWSPTWMATLDGEEVGLERDAASGRVVVPWERGRSGRVRLEIQGAPSR